LYEFYIWQVIWFAFMQTTYFMKKTLLFTLVLLQLLSGCLSSKKALNSGNYDQAIYKSVNKLR
jgi:hypothetical protein